MCQTDAYYQLKSNHYHCTKKDLTTGQVIRSLKIISDYSVCFKPLKNCWTPTNPSDKIVAILKLNHSACIIDTKSRSIVKQAIK